MMRKTFGLRWWNWAAATLIFPLWLHAAEQHGHVQSNQLSVPGAVVTATQGERKFVTVSDEHGNYSFAEIPDGVWKIKVSMLMYSSVEQDVAVHVGAPVVNFDLKMLSVEQILASTKLTTATVTPPKTTTDTSVEISKREGLIVNGSVNNAATSQFSLDQAFGNTRTNSRGLYNGGLGITFGDSALDARAYSLSGVQADKPGYNDITAMLSIGGPLVIPHLLQHGPNFALNYQWTRDSNAADNTGLVPTQLQRTTTASMIDPVAQALLNLYPLPNVAGDSSYNYQLPVINGTHKDALQAHVEKNLGNRESLKALFSLEGMRADTNSLFGFRDTTTTLGLDTQLSYQRRFAGNLFTEFNYRFSRTRSQAMPFFENRVNISGDAGMTGNNQDPSNWGPPTLVFSSGIVSLTDSESSFDRNETNSIGGTVQWYYRGNAITAGGDFRKQEFNYYSQGDPRGTFTFTGDATGSDFSDFLNGIPDTAALVSGNPDKYLRGNMSDLYATDDWHLAPDLTMNVGVRWEYDSPVSELKNRLANLDVAPGFSSAKTVVAGAPIGAITGEYYSNALLHPDRGLVEPRLALSWRPLPASSLVLRAGYGIYADSSVYESIALQMAQQAPFAASISSSNNTCAQTLKTGPIACAKTTADTFGIDPDYRVGYAQVWQASVQRDLPAALQMVATYQGIKGSNGMQQSLPNTYPAGAANPCSSCPSGFNYRTSSGSSNREAGMIQLRRRLRSGLTASLLYTYSKSTDDDSALGGQGPLAAGTTAATATTISTAQNWRDLRAERSLSNFDQRNLLNATLQYTTGMGLGGRTLMNGSLGRFYKEWTVSNTVTTGSGMPETPIYLTTVLGTGFTGSIRPDRTSAQLYEAPSGRFINPAAFAAPQVGQWGTAGRNSITGPSTFIFNMSLLRTFRPTQRYYLDVHVDATNVLNHPVYASYNTTVDPTTTNSLFGLPASVNAMRGIQVTTRLRF